MSRSHMMVRHRRGSRFRLRETLARLCLAWLVGIVGMVAVPAAAHARPRQEVASAAASSPLQDPGVRPHMCRPEPPDYPGCTAAQVRPLVRARFRAEYTGHASGYRYYRMGQHRRGVIFAHLTPALNSKLARLYHEAVERYAHEHKRVVIDPEGVRHLLVSYPRYRTWAGFRTNTTALCNGNNVTVHFPTQYCWSITRLGQAGAVINSLLRSTVRIAFSCNGFAIGGWASGTYAAWRMGTGLLVGGYYGAVGVEIACQTSNLWNWVTNLW